MNLQMRLTRNTTPKEIAYWVTTTIVALAVLSGGVAYLIHRPDNVAGMLQLGYPLYFVTILGFWKVLGAIAILVPRFPRLKEWAYAGIFFEMTGAFATHVANGSGAEHLVATGVLAVLTLVSWGLRPPSRTLGVLFPDRAWRLPFSHGTAVAPAR